MPRKFKGEVRTRVIRHLPVNDAQETKAFYEVLGYLHGLRHENLGVGGFTHSQMRPAVFHGYWWPEDAEEPVSDEIILCFIDYLLPPDSQKLWVKLRELKDMISDCYKRRGSAQDEVWVVAYHVARQD